LTRKALSAQRVLLPVFRFWSIDPGDVHNALARWVLPRDYSGEWRAPQVEQVDEYDPGGLIDLVEQGIDELDALIVEEFRLYPWLAREQGYSAFRTVEQIGVLKYIARQANVPLVLQGANVKKMALLIARGHGFPLKKLQGGREDFVANNQHKRDAIAHGVWWAYRGEASPLRVK
jgi:hypothetical protein